MVTNIISRNPKSNLGLYQSESKKDFIVLSLRDRYDKETKSDHKIMPIVKSHQGWKSEYFGLTQVNRLIRSEYLPLHYYSDKVCVEPQDLRAYGKAFLGGGAPHPSRPSIVVSGYVSFRSWLGDLTPLLKLAAEHTDIYFISQDYVDPQKPGGHWGRNSSTFVRTVNNLTCIAQNPRYKEGWCVAEGMISWMHIDEWTYPKLRINIKREYFNACLDDWGRTNSEFLEITGLDLGLLYFCIEYPN
jgi:hypothetical protein